MEYAILKLVVAVVSPIIGKLIEKLSASYLGGDVTFEEIKELHTIILPQIHLAIKATEEIPMDTLKPWLMDLKVVAFKAEDVLDLYEYEVIKKKVTFDYKPLQIFKAKPKEILADMLPKTKLKKSLEKLKQSANKAKDLLSFIAIRQTAPQWDANSQQSTHTVSRMSSPIFGRKEESINLINMLINETGDESICNRTSIPVLAVTGIGGAGKTTIAQAIYNDEGVKFHFHTRMWVHVSRNFDVHRVLREIIEHGGSKCSDISSLNVLQNMVEEILNSKKFFLILDDIWCEDKEEWDKLLIPLNEVGVKESRILITTRTKKMALSLGVKNEHLVPLKELKDGDILSILKHYAFGDAKKIIEDRALADAGEKIANKLKNSPLAARLIGSLLGGVGRNVDEWEMVLKRDMPSEPLDRLLLSFQFLRPHLQRCFAFCSLFPKGQIFHTSVIDDLVRTWIAEGFVEVLEDNELTTLEKGRRYFKELVSYSFFQSRPHDPSTYVIHDLLNDLAEKVSKGHCFRIEADGPIDILPTTVHLSIMAGLPKMPLPDVSVLVNLRTLMCEDSRIGSSLLDACTKLRVLYYTCSMPELPRSIGQLKHLRYLKAERVKKLPDSFSKLYHLQFLDLPIHKIERMPKSFSNLVNLQLQCLLHADLTRTIPEIGKLTSLQTLESYSVETSREFGIGQLKNLDRLGGSLEIERLENVEDKIEATEARLNQKKHLKELSLRWNRSISSRDVRVDDEEVLEEMEPHSNLKKLEISRYGGAKTPSWMRHILPGLQSLQLIDCPNLTGVPHLPHSLQSLTMFNSSGFEDLFSVFISFNDEEEEEEEKQRRLHQQNCGLLQPFALNYLSIADCYVLREKTFNLSLRKFDLLRRLELRGLPKLTSLRLGPNLRELPWIVIKDCENLQSLEGIGALPHLECLEMGGLTSLLMGPNLKRLCKIGIKDCENLQSLEGIGALPHLEHLEVNDLPELTGIGNLQALKSLTVFRCPELTTGARAAREGAIADRLPSLEGTVSIGEQGLNSIVRLKIMGGSQDRPFSTEEEDLFLQLTSIKELSFHDYMKLPSLPANLEKLSSLEDLFIMNCPEMESLPNLPTSLHSLRIQNCREMESLPNLPTSLIKLHIKDCPKMESLPNIPTSLNTLRMFSCPELTDKYGVGGPLHHKISHIPVKYIW